jgi:hypothetical protein
VTASFAAADVAFVGAGFGATVGVAFVVATGAAGFGATAGVAFVGTTGGAGFCATAGVAFVGSPGAVGFVVAGVSGDGTIGIDLEASAFGGGTVGGGDAGLGWSVLTGGPDA